MAALPILVDAIIAKGSRSALIWIKKSAFFRSARSGRGPAPGEGSRERQDRAELPCRRSRRCLASFSSSAVRPQPRAGLSSWRCRCGWCAARELRCDRALQGHHQPAQTPGPGRLRAGQSHSDPARVFRLWRPSPPINTKHRSAGPWARRRTSPPRALQSWQGRESAPSLDGAVQHGA